ncbi:class I SAM-dependent methyltransferase [Candidatus Riflebacteria bacterium]
MTAWFEDESFWIETYPFMFPQQRFDMAWIEAEKILNLLEFKGRSVLDLCCGPGRIAIALAKRNLKVTGVDRSTFLLEKAKKRSKEEKLEVNWVLEDMRNFIQPDSFDLVLNIFTSFGFFEKEVDEIRVLKNVFQSLKKGGAFFIDLMGKEILAGKFQATTSEKLPDSSIIIQRHEVLSDWTRIRNEWLLNKGTTLKTFKFEHTIYSGQELKELLFKAGFQKIKLYGDFDGTPYGLNATRLIAVCHRE